MSNKPNSVIDETAVHNDLLSLEALLVARLYLYTLFEKTFGGKPNGQLLNLVASSTTIDVMDEYSHTDEIMEKLMKFVTVMPAKLEGKEYLESVASEYTYFFEGPEDLPAYPWEAPYTSHEPTVFQRSTLAVRSAYQAQNLQLRMHKKVPDDHVSTMCAFMAYLAKESLDAFRYRRLDELRALMGSQYSFVRNHMTNWLPEYAKHARSAKSAFLYPQLISGIEAFSRQDEIFISETLVWINDASEDRSPSSVDVSFDEVENVLSQFAALQLQGLDEKELVPIS